VPNLVYFAASIGELAHGEKLHTQSFDHSASLFDAPGTEAPVLRNINYCMRRLYEQALLLLQHPSTFCTN